MYRYLSLFRALPIALTLLLPASVCLLPTRPALAQAAGKKWVETAATKRIALVIGNAAYKNGSPLTNPVNDAVAVARVLKTLGFEVIMVTDGTQREMMDAIDAFGDRLTPDTVALCYYSGHGIQMDGTNYLLPVDFRGKSRGDVQYEAVAVGRILGRLDEKNSPVNVVILDACRNNPFKAFTRSGARGLTKMDAPRGTLIAYATSPGDVADDNTGGANGLYTQELLKHLAKPGEKVEDVFKSVLEDVIEASEGKQRPWVESSIVGRLYLAKPVTTTVLVSAAVYAEQGQKAIDAQKWTDAETAYRLALESEQGNALYHNSLGVALYNQKRYTDAEPHYRKAVSGKPGEAIIQHNLGQCLNLQGKYADAVPFFREASRLLPESWAYRNWLGSTLVQSGGFVEAEKVMRETVQAVPRDHSNQNWLGRALLGLNRYADAEVSFREAARLAPLDGNNWFWLGQVQFNQRNYRDGEASLREAVRLSPDDAANHTWLALCLHNLEKYTDAETHFKKSIQLNPNDRITYANLAACLVGQKRNEEAKPYAQKSLDMGYPAKDHWVFKTLGLAP